MNDTKPSDTQQLDDHHEYFLEGYRTMAAERDNWEQDCLLCWFLPNRGRVLTIASLTVSLTGLQGKAMCLGPARVDCRLFLVGNTSPLLIAS